MEPRVDAHTLSRSLLRRASLAVWALMAGLGGCGGPSRPGGPGLERGLELGPVAPVAAAGREVGMAVRTVPWRHAGTGVLRCLGWRADCGCVAVDGLPPQVRPGDHGSLTLQVRPRRRPGRDRVCVRFHFAAPAGREAPAGGLLATLAVERRGPPGPVLAPAHLHAGTVARGERVRVELDVLWDPEDVLLACGQLRLGTIEARATWSRIDPAAGRATLRVETQALGAGPLVVQLGAARTEIQWVLGP